MKADTLRTMTTRSSKDGKMKMSFHFTAGEVQFQDINEIHFIREMQDYYQDLIDRISKLDCSREEQSLIAVFQSLQTTRVMHNPIDVIREQDGSLTVIRGNQRLCALRAMGYDGEIPYRVWDSVEDLPSYNVPDPENSLDTRLVVIYPRPHVRGALVVRIGEERHNIPSNGSLSMPMWQYVLIKDQIPRAHYLAMTHETKEEK